MYYRKLAAILILILVVCSALANPVGTELEEDLKAYLESTRQSRVILKPGEYRLSTTFSYSMNGNDFGVGTASQTGFNTNLDLTYGLFEDLELSLNLPFGNSQSDFDLLDSSVSQNHTGFGSLIVGIRYALLHETGSRPEITTSLQLGLPTQSQGEPATVVRAGIDILSSLDPVILTAGFGVAHDFENDDVVLDTSAGMVFGVTDRIALGVDLKWVSNLRGFGDALNDTISFKSRVSIVSGRNVIEPWVSIGLTESTPDATLGVTFSRRF